MGATYILRKGVAEPSDLKDVTANAAELNTLDSSLKSVWFEDFRGTWAIGDAGPADRWASTAGGGTSNEVATTVAAALNGAVTLSSASDDGNHAANGSTLTAIALDYKANQGGLAIEAGFSVDDVTNGVALFIGFTDVVSSTVELPIFLVTTAIDSDATNAAGVGYDFDGTTKEWFHGGVKADTDTTPAYSGSAPSDGTYVVVRAEISAAGVAIGNPVPSAVTITTALTPAFIIANRSANQCIATIDYIKTEQNRG